MIKVTDFTPNNDLDAEQRSALLKINLSFPDFVQELSDLMPPSTQRDAAMEHLLAAKFLAVQSVTHGRLKGGSIPAPAPVVHTMKADVIINNPPGIMARQEEPLLLPSNELSDAEFTYQSQLDAAANALGGLDAKKQAPAVTIEDAPKAPQASEEEAAAKARSDAKARAEAKEAKKQKAAILQTAEVDTPLKQDTSEDDEKDTF